MRIDRNIKKLITDSSRSLKERVFVVLTLTAVGVAFLALVGDIIYNDNIAEIITLILALILTPITTYIGIKTNKVDLAIKLVSFGIIFGIMPIIFIFGGGISGGGVPWLVFSFLYIGLVLSGTWRVIMLSVLTIIVVALYGIAFYYPDMIHQHKDAVLYVDSALAVIEVGYVCFVMTWFQNLLFMEENRRATEEVKKVEEMNRSQNRFFSSMSHEIRTPINSILGLNEIILRQADASDEIIKDAGNIQGAGRMLLSLINDILDFSKIEAGKMDIVPVNYNIASLFSEIVNMIWLRAEQKGLEFKIEIDPSIPSELYGDEVRIKQILVNLLNNAVKYTKSGSVTLHVEKEEIQDDQVVLLFSVTDTGMGIKQDAIPFLFDAFQRVDEEKNMRIEGTGLGLSIVKQLVDLMGGRITVNSVYTQGSTFTVTLQQKIARNDAVGNINITNLKGTNGEKKYSAGFKAPDVKILIVDDNEMNLEVEKKLLIGTDIYVDTAKSGDEALLKTLDNSYDIILMDHLMPEMDGIECMQYIRKQPNGLNNRVPIIVLTANAGSENRELYSRSGFDDYLVKPVSGKQLEEMLISHLPENKIIVEEGSDISKLSMNTSRGYSKRLPVVIATSNMCDLPQNVLEEYQIDIIPFIIRNNNKTYYDGIEVETDELVRYMREGVSFESDSPSVEEYEQFFGRVLKKAHNVIYISMSSFVSQDYTRAKEAAKAYGNVKIFDSRTNSTAMGMLVVMAIQMASHGDSPEKIVEELDKIKDGAHCGLVADGSYFIQKRAVFNNAVSKVMKTLSVWPFIRYKNGKYAVGKFSLGDPEKCYAKYVDYALPRLAKPDLDLLVVVYTAIGEDNLQMIEERIRKRFKFKHILFQKVSAVMSLNCGPDAFGIIYYDKGEYPYTTSSMIINDSFEDEVFDENDEVSDVFDIDRAERIINGFKENAEDENEDKKEIKWYEGIEGIDPETAITNSGSEDAFKTVLEIFYESIGDRSSEIENYYNEEDWDGYTIKVHALKSSSKLIGANELAQKALELENAGKEKNIDFIREHHNGFMADYKKYNDILSQMFGESKDNEIIDDQVDDEAKQEEVSGDEDDFIAMILESTYEALKDAAMSKDASVIEETFAEMSEYEVPDKDKELLDTLRKNYEAGNFDEMISAIDNRTL